MQTRRQQWRTWPFLVSLSRSLFTLFQEAGASWMSNQAPRSVAAMLPGHRRWLEPAPGRNQPHSFDLWTPVRRDLISARLLNSEYTLVFTRHADGRTNVVICQLFLHPLGARNPIRKWPPRQKKTKKKQIQRILVEHSWHWSLMKTATFTSLCILNICVYIVHKYIVCCIIDKCSFGLVFLLHLVQETNWNVRECFVKNLQTKQRVSNLAKRHLE